MSESVEQIFEGVAKMTMQPKVAEGPFNTAEYQAFIDSMVPFCHCADKYRPCDGVLAGGLCDDQQDDDPPHEYELDINGNEY